MSFLRLSKVRENSFVMPDNPDLASVSIKDVKMILPKETANCDSKRRGSSMYNFNVNFSKLRMG